MIKKIKQNSPMNDRKFLVCVCGDISHQLVIEGTNEGDVIVSMHLTPFTFWKRLWNGVKYIFGSQSKYGDFEEVILDKHHVDTLQDMVDFLKKGEEL